jgi:cell division transport system ATP-binding protein
MGLIRFQRVTKRYGATVALEDVDWEVAAGERVVVLGASGAGKTTLLRLASMEIAPSSGVVRVGSFVSGEMNARRMALLRRTLGIVFEEARLLADRSVADNVAIALHVTGEWDGQRVREKVNRALDEVGVAERAASAAGRISAGERQRVALARALVREPPLLLADDPAGRLDRGSAERLLDCLRRVSERGTAVVLATHDEVTAQSFGGRVTRLVGGRIAGA